jgi:hypothetical protein
MNASPLRHFWRVLPVPRVGTLPGQRLELIEVELSEGALLVVADFRGK